MIAAYTTASYSGTLALPYNDGKDSKSLSLELLGDANLCAAGSTKDLSQEVFDAGSAYYLSADTTLVAQSFLYASDKLIKKVSLSLYMGASSGLTNLKIEIRNDNANAPGSTVLASVVSTPQIIASSRSWFDFTLDAPAVLTANQKYWIVLTYTGITGAQYVDKQIGGSDYTDGNAAISNDSGTTWSVSSTHDLTFKVESCN